MAEERFFSHQIELSRHLRTTTPKPSSNRKEEEEEEEDGQVSNLFESPTQACTRLSSDHRLSIHLERKDDEGILDPHQEEDDREEINQINIARQTFLDDLRTGRVSLRNEIRGELDDEVGGEREAENLYETLIRIQPWDRLTCSVLGWEVVFI
ncbi:hypothetical protein IE53DRAFT_225970 [Violaceomyces palustris]|uniref:Uncharacterized protein n=1 Tax=Violaceomyces palustris TaxID=1673888 RepID=A0ACD0NPY8_9BASI|nr:hypothetical protein IE53DRAFT_225970 [Violaceomyces palustris]